MKRIIISAALILVLALAAGAQDFVGNKVPAEFTVELDFSTGENPFATPAVGKKKQTPEGETYAYTFGNGAKQCTLNFVLCQGPNGNYYSFPNEQRSYLSFNRPEEKPDNCAYIKIPAVPGRYLKAIEITIATSTAWIFVCSAPEKVTSGEGLVAKFSVPDQGTATHTFTYPETQVNTPYYLYRNISTAFRISNLKLTYSSAKKGK